MLLAELLTLSGTYSGADEEERLFLLSECSSAAGIAKEIKEETPGTVVMKEEPEELKIFMCPCAEFGEDAICADESRRELLLLSESAVRSESCE